MNRNALQYFVCLLVASLASCASTQPLEQRRLPFHVAIVPMAAPIVGDVSSGELPGEPTELLLKLDGAEVTGAVSQALAEYCFSGVTVLEYEEQDGYTDAFQRQRSLVESAREAGADLIVELSLRYAPEIYRENSSTFWLNFPLFFFAGPTNWFLGDNSYFADVELTTAIYDLNVIEAGTFDLDDQAARVVTASSRYSGTDLDFIDRSTGLGDYVLGILIPSGFLARQSADTSKELHEQILKELQFQAVQGVQSRSSEIVTADWIAPMFIRPGEVKITRKGDQATLRGRIRLRQNSLADRVHSLHLEAGAQRVTVQPTLDEKANVEGFDVLKFTATVPVAAGATKVRVQCEAGSRDPYVRSYTFPLPTSANE